MGLFWSYSVIGGNYRLLLSRFNMNVKNITNEWNNSKSQNTVIVKTADQIKELVHIRDNDLTDRLIRQQCCSIIDYLCTN